MAGSKAQGRHDDLGQANAIGDLTCETWLEDELHGASDGKKHLSIGGAVSSSFGLEFAASVLVNGLFGLDFGAKASFDTNIEAVIPSDEQLQERGIPNGQFLRELDDLRRGT